MQRQDFIILLQRYLDDACTPAEKEVMDYWYDLLDEEYDQKVSKVSQEELEAVLWAKINENLNPTEKQPFLISAPRWWQNRALYWAAASLFLFLGLAYLLPFGGIVPGQNLDSATAQLVAGMQEETNTESVAKWIVLEDSTRILLEPGSRIHFTSPFAPNLRAVYLTGDAFFEVTHDQSRPLVVHSGDIVTKVVGTSFGIHFQDDELEVSVATGRVIVEKENQKVGNSSRSTSDGVVLTPNQKVTYYSRNNYFVTGLVENPQPIALPKVVAPNLENPFQFEAVPLEQVLSRIEDTYGVKIVQTNPSIQNCPVTADLSQQALYSKMDILCAALRATFEVKGTSLVLSGGSCE